MSNDKWIYERDFNDNLDNLAKECQRLHDLGYRVFVQGYSAMQCYEFCPPCPVCSNVGDSGGKQHTYRDDCLCRLPTEQLDTSKEP